MSKILFCTDVGKKNCGLKKHDMAILFFETIRTVIGLCRFEKGPFADLSQSIVQLGLALTVRRGAEETGGGKNFDTLHYFFRWGPA